MEILQRLIKTLIEWLKDIVTQIMTGGGVIDIDKYAEASGPGVVALQEKIRRKTPLYLQFSFSDIYHKNVKRRISFRALTEWALTESGSSCLSAATPACVGTNPISGMSRALFGIELSIPANILWTLYAINSNHSTALRLPFSLLERPVVVPNGITMIEADACVSVEPTAVSFPPSLEIIGERAFANRYNLSKIEIPPNGNLNKICEGAFRSCSCLTAVTLPKKLEVIESDAFASIRDLQTVTIQSAKEIRSRAFRDCKRLNSLQLPYNLERILDEAFYGCRELEEVTLPATLEFIGQSAFQSCPRLKKVKCRTLTFDRMTAFDAHVQFETILVTAADLNNEGKAGKKM